MQANQFLFLHDPQETLANEVRKLRNFEKYYSFGIELQSNLVVTSDQELRPPRAGWKPSHPFQREAAGPLLEVRKGSGHRGVTDIDDRRGDQTEVLGGRWARHEPHQARLYRVDGVRQG